jgi:predicted ATPase
MKIQVKELGAIKEGTIDLSKKLNVFCGPNGTGKTYMAYVIYALTKLNNKSLGIRLDDSIVKAALSGNEFSISINASEIWQFRKKEIDKVKNELWSLFSIAQDKSESFFKDTSIECDDTFESFEAKMLEMSIDNILFRMYGYSFVLLKNKGELSVLITLVENTKKDESFAKFMEIAFLSRLYSLLSFYPITNSIIFPVERNSIYTFSKELSIKRNDTLDHLQASLSQNKELNVLDLLFKRTTRYPLPIRDGLEFAEDLERIQKTNSTFHDFGLEIEKKLLKGKVIITKEGSVEFSSDKAPKTKLSFHQSSSIVKTLASLVIYLKYEAVHNDLVIIDEPELNLHPNNQVKLARIFAKLINKGLRLIVSTHSDYIVREFNNLIMVSSNKTEVKEIAKTIGGYEDDEYINKNEIAAYVFDFKKSKKEESKKSEVKNIEVSEMGFEISTVDETIDEQNRISEELYYTLKYGKKDD